MSMHHMHSMLCVTTMQALLPVAGSDITSNSTCGRGTSPVKPWPADVLFSAADVSQSAPLSGRADFSHSCGPRSTAGGCNHANSCCMCCIVVVVCLFCCYTHDPANDHQRCVLSRMPLCLATICCACSGTSSGGFWQLPIGIAHSRTQAVMSNDCSSNSLKSMT